jgi:hypothetical protein
VWTLRTSGDLAEHRKRIDAALLDGYESVTAHFEQAYLAVLAMLGFRLRESLTIRQLTISVGALAEGCALRGRVDEDSMYGVKRATGPEGEEQTWTLFGVGLEAMVHQFVEIDPDSTVGTAPAPGGG